MTNDNKNCGINKAGRKTAKLPRLTTFVSLISGSPEDWDKFLPGIG